MTLKEWCIEKNNTKLINQWDQKRNTHKPSEVTFGSNKKVWWIGECGHNWEASVNDRTQGQGCPYCAGKRVLKGFNDLETLSPKIAAQWHPKKTGN